MNLTVFTASLGLSLCWTPTELPENVLWKIICTHRRESCSRSLI